MRNHIRYFDIILFAVLSISYGKIAHATVPLDGYLIAEKACPALHSINTQSNPGSVMLQPGFAYTVTGKNKPSATHYLIQINGIQTPQRWVEIACGKLLTDCNPTVPTPSTGVGSGTSTSSSKDYVLAISWQPGFCQTHQAKTECQTQTPDRHDATNFTLHGLWPQPRNNTYCGVSDMDKSLDRNNHWNLLPGVTVADSTRTAMSVSMPGVASFLERHEWVKHGTCYSQTPEEYYSESLMLLDQINNSSVRDLFADNIGKRVTATQIRARFDQAFGNGAGTKIKVTCTGRLITELTVNLKGDVNSDTRLADLLKDSPRSSQSCTGGVIDPVGF